MRQYKRGEFSQFIYSKTLFSYILSLSGGELFTMTSIDNSKVGERIKKIRLNYNGKKLTQQEFAELLNPVVDKSAVRKWEKGLNLPNKERLAQIAQIGNVTTDYLLFGKTLNGHGERIKSIREDLGLTLEEFGHLFSPVLSSQTISNWESENLLPDLKQIRVIGNLVGIDYREILFGNAHLSEFSLDTYSNINDVENNLSSLELSPEEILKSDEYLINMNNLRMLMGDNPHSFNYLHLLSKRLTEFVDQKENSGYDYLNDTIDDLKKIIENFCTIYFEEK